VNVTFFVYLSEKVVVSENHPVCTSGKTSCQSLNLHSLDLDVTVVNHLSPCDHIKHCCQSSAHMRSNAIHRCFVSRVKWSLLHVYLVYVRPLLEYNSVVWSPHFKQDTVLIENVSKTVDKENMKIKHCFLSWSFASSWYTNLELRRLYFDLIYCYKIVFGLVHVNLITSFYHPLHHRQEDILTNCLNAVVA